MIRGFGASKLGMAAEQTRTEVLANNLANVNTNGFKKSVAISSEFQTLLLQRMNDSTDGGPVTVGELGNGTVVDQVLPVNLQGVITETGRPLDFAIEGPGQFVTQGPAGNILTRNGAFHQRDDGTLVSVDNLPVLMRTNAGDLVPIVAAGFTPEIQPDGAVVVNGRVVGRLEIDGATRATKIHGGALEASNVELAKEMTDLIVALRSFQVNQRAMSMQDQTLGRAVSEIGKV